MRAKGPLSHAALHMILLGGSFLFLFPLFWMLSTSLKPIEETMLTPPQWIPSALHFDNYLKAVTHGREILGYIPFLEYGKNTLLLCALGVVGTVISNALIAYGFARLRWPGRNIFFGITLATMMIPFPVHTGLVRVGVQHIPAAAVLPDDPAGTLGCGSGGRLLGVPGVPSRHSAAFEAGTLCGGAVLLPVHLE